MPGTGGRRVGSQIQPPAGKSVESIGHGLPEHGQSKAPFGQGENVRIRQPLEGGHDAVDTGLAVHLTIWPRLGLRGQLPLVGDDREWSHAKARPW